jgi:hypothetical protein
MSIVLLLNQNFIFLDFMGMKIWSALLGKQIGLYLCYYLRPIAIGALVTTVTACLITMIQVYFIFEFTFAIEGATERYTNFISPLNNIKLDKLLKLVFFQ